MIEQTFFERFLYCWKYEVPINALIFLVVLVIAHFVVLGVFTAKSARLYPESRFGVCYAGADYTWWTRLIVWAVFGYCLWGPFSAGVQSGDYRVYKTLFDQVVIPMALIPAVGLVFLDIIVAKIAYSSARK